MAVARWFTVIWFASTLIGLGLPGDALPDTPTGHFDKVAHVAIFAVGTALALLGWPRHRGRVLLLMLLFAPLSEAWQAVLPTGRQADALDVVANTVGIGLGWGLARLAWRTPRTVEA